MAADEESDAEEMTGLPGTADLDESLDAMMAPSTPPEDERSSEGDGPLRLSRGAAPLRPTADTEKTLGLEVGRLFGINPRLLVDPGSAARPRLPAEDAPGEDDGGEDPAA